MYVTKHQHHNISFELFLTYLFAFLWFFKAVAATQWFSFGINKALHLTSTAKYF